jgi:hypothetical protein
MIRILVFMLQKNAFKYRVCSLTQRVKLGEEGHTSEVDEWASDEDQEYWDCCGDTPHFVI